MNKTELKTAAIRMYNNTHRDNANKTELLRCINVCNGDFMARHGEQLSDAIISEVFTELEQLYFTDLTLKQQILKALPFYKESDFGSHCSDLYVLWSAKLAVWLRENYKHHKNITSFIGAKGSDWQGRRVYDIPFAHVAKN